MKYMMRQLLVSIMVAFILFSLPICVSAVEDPVVTESGLREAVTNGGVIEIDGDINLTDTAIEVTSDITIKSKGAIVTIKQSNDRHFNVSNGATLILEGIILDGDNDKGGIFADSSSKIIVGTGAIIQNCRSFVLGGGIRAEGGSMVTVTGGAVIKNCSSDIGGGIYAELSDVIVSDGAKIENCQAEVSDGGGIYALQCTVVVKGGSKVNNNIAKGDGGGIRAAASTVTIESGSKVNSNIAYGSGGGVQALGVGGELILEAGSEINNNISKGTYGGGGIFASVPVSIYGDVINNTADYDGGGIASSEGINIYGKVSKNSAHLGGGIFSNGGFLFLDSSSIVSENLGSFNGGGIFKQEGAAIIFGTVTENTALTGGGIHIYKASIILKDGSSVFENEAGSSGGGIYAEEDCSVTVESGSEVNNNTAEHEGGGIWLFNGYMDIAGHINGNKAVHPYTNTYGFGGGIYARDAELQIKNGAQINNNLAHADGGGLHVLGPMSELLIEAGSEINGNKSESHGGGIYVSFVFSEINIYGDVTNNTAFYDGGGIWTNSEVHIWGNVSNNFAVYDGGGIYSNIATVVLENGSTIDRNEAQSGGGIYNYDGDFTVLGTVTNNIAMSRGGGIYNYSNGFGGELSLEDGSIVEGNSAPEGGGIFNHDSKVTALGRVKDNTASAGGGIYNYAYNLIPDKDACIIISGIVEGNDADLGGGIYNCLGTIILETDSIVDNNTAMIHGGGIYESGGNTTVYGAVSNNTTTIGIAGGIYAQTDKMVTIDGGSIINNKAAEQGGGIYLIGDSMLVAKNNAIFSGNISETNRNPYIGGGAICTEDMTYSNLNIDSTVKFSGNSAESFCGYTDQPDVTDYIRTASSSKASYHPLNNWDINYFSYPVTIRYQTNTGGSVSGKKEEVIYVTPDGSYEHTGTTVKGYKFIEWKLNGEKQEGVVPGVDGVNDENNIIVLVYKKVSTGGSTSPEEIVNNDSDTSSTDDTSDDDNNNEEVEEDKEDEDKKDKEDEDKKDENKKNTENNDIDNSSTSNTDGDNTDYYDESNYVIFDYETIIIDPVLPLGPWELNSTNHFAYMIGYADGAVKPQGNITREEAATIFFRLLEEDTRMELLSRTNNFSDVDESRWSNVAISTLSSAGIIKGYEDGTFQPSEKITRAEFASIASRFDTTYISTVLVYPDTTEHWAKYEISRSTALGWIRGNPDGKFYPDMYITRAEAATFVNRMLLRLVENENDLHSDMTKWQDNSDTNAWYYLAVQEATNSHDYDRKFEGSLYEVWYEIIESPDWAQYER